MKTFAEILPDLLAGKLCQFDGEQPYQVQLETDHCDRFHYWRGSNEGWLDNNTWDEMSLGRADLAEAKWTVVA